MRGQRDFVNVVWVRLLCHGTTSVSKEQLREKEKNLRKRKKKWLEKTIGRLGK